jgi:uncharacterized glyoxalase superfamily protein PhnB
MKHDLQLCRRDLLIGAAAMGLSACAAGAGKRPSNSNSSNTPTATKETAMNLSLYHCYIATSDHDKALTFYKDTLGLDVRNDVEYGGMRWLTMGTKSQPDVNIILESVLADPSAPEADRKTMNEMLAKGYLRGVNFTTDDCDATFEHIKKAGFEVRQEPKDQFYGVRDCAFRDPSGNEIRFSQKK